MISSVMLTGDAGGLNYIGSNLTDENKSPFKYCCGCTERDVSRAESDLTPLRRTTVQKDTKELKELSPVEHEKDFIFRWTPAVIAKYSNLELMRKPEFTKGSLGKSMTSSSLYGMIAASSTNNSIY